MTTRKKQEQQIKTNNTNNDHDNAPGSRQATATLKKCRIYIGICICCFMVFALFMPREGPATIPQNQDGIPKRSVLTECGAAEHLRRFYLSHFLNS